MLSIAQFLQSSKLCSKSRCINLLLSAAGILNSLEIAKASDNNIAIAIGLEEGDELCWVRLSAPGDSVLIGSKAGMTIHFRLNDQELRPLGRTARGVRSMNLRSGDSLVSMDVLPVELADQVASSHEEDIDDGTNGHSASDGPWVLVASASGLGKRVPVTQFRLQKRAGMGLRAMKFRREGDELVGLRVLGQGEELLLVSERGVIVRTSADKIPQQSRAATGVRLQRLDSGDRLSEVVLVPPNIEEQDPQIDVDSSSDSPGLNETSPL